ncbi:hypothetical protein ACHQM5_014721 [Ranunculus cassubicifolius]
MESLKRLIGHPAITTSLMLLVMLSITPINAQITTPCTASMITNFTPCLNFITGSSSNGGSPTTQCCGSVKSLLSTSVDCACLIFTANVPLQLPINRSLAISLPRMCKIGGVPIQCKAAAAPLPPVVQPLSPAPSPDTSSPTASTIPEAIPPTLAPTESTSDLAPTPDSPTVEADAPVANTGRRPVVTPNAAIKASDVSSLSLVFALGVLALKFC